MGLGGPLGGIILGRRGGGPYGGRGPGGTGGNRTQSAGTDEIARRSGGDNMSVDDASALETTLARIRQRYALHFNVPAGVKPRTPGVVGRSGRTAPCVRWCALTTAVRVVKS